MGWEGCAASLGGDCCPAGWKCGTASCESVQVQASATVTEVRPKEMSGVGGRARGEGGELWLWLGVLVVGWVL